MTHPFDRIPELAGVATYASAARVGYSVDENVRRQLRLHWVERRLMAILVAHLTSEPVWEVKCGFALHQWQCAEHVDALRRRIAEMRSPTPRLDVPPEHDETAAALELFLQEVGAAQDTAELLAGIYRVALPALAEAYRHHLEHTNPLVDHPTRRLMRVALMDIEEAVAWGTDALSAVRDSLTVTRYALRAETDDWEAHLRTYLAAAGGIAGDAEVVPVDVTLNAQRVTAGQPWRRWIERRAFDEFTYPTG